MLTPSSSYFVLLSIPPVKVVLTETLRESYATMGERAEIPDEVSLRLLMTTGIIRPPEAAICLGPGDVPSM